MKIIWCKLQSISHHP